MHGYPACRGDQWREGHSSPSRALNFASDSLKSSISGSLTRHPRAISHQLRGLDNACQRHPSATVNATNCASLLASRFPWATPFNRNASQKSILDYLYSCGYHDAFGALQHALPNQSEFRPDVKAKWAGLLEKKWTSVIRLQKKIMDLEKENAHLKEELASTGTSNSRKGHGEVWLPGRGGGPRHCLSGHRAPIAAVAFHPLFSNVVSASEDGSLKVWDYENGELERTLKGHTKGVCDADYDSKGLLLVSCSSDLTLKIWDCSKNHQCIKTLYDHDHSVSSCRFVPGDTHVISASRDQTIKVWEVATSHCVRTIRGHSEWVRGAWPSPDGGFVLSVSNDQTGRMWDFGTGECRAEFRGHSHVVETAAFAPVAANENIRELAGILSQPGSSKSTSPAFVATGSRDKEIRIWDMSGQCLKTLVGHDNWVRALTFHPSGKFLLSASDDKTLRVWDLKTGRCVKTLEAHGHFITCMAWARASVGGGAPISNGDSTTQPLDVRIVNVLATGSVDLSVNIW